MTMRHLGRVGIRAGGRGRTAWLTRRRRGRRVPAVLVVLVIAVLAAAGIAAWCIRHRAGDSAARGQASPDATFDQDALDRAAGEGMLPATA